MINCFALNGNQVLRLKPCLNMLECLFNFVYTWYPNQPTLFGRNEHLMFTPWALLNQSQTLCCVRQPKQFSQSLPVPVLHSNPRHGTHQLSDPVRDSHTNSQSLI